MMIKCIWPDGSAQELAVCSSPETCAGVRERHPDGVDLATVLDVPGPRPMAARAELVLIANKVKELPAELVERARQIKETHRGLPRAHAAQRPASPAVTTHRRT